eukprot:jgi/Botrbrau1/1767/Bobra.0217s0022.1
MRPHLPAAFISSIKEGILPAADALAVVLPTLVAFCLNNVGLELVRSSDCLQCLVPIFTTKTYLRALQVSDSPNTLGSHLEELMRHVTRLRPEGVEVLLTILRTLCVLGGVDDPIPAPQPATPSSIASTPAPAAGASPMDTDQLTGARDTPPARDPTAQEGESQAADVDMVTGGGAGPSGDAAPEAGEGTANAPTGSPAATASVGWRPLDVKPASDASSYLSECIAATARMLEGVLANQDVAKLFASRGAIPVLLQLYRLPALPPTFGSSSASHALLAAIRVLATTHADAIAKYAVEAMQLQISSATALGQSVAGKCIPELPALERDEYVRAISSTEGPHCPGRCCCSQLSADGGRCFSAGSVQ